MSPERPVDLVEAHIREALARTSDRPLVVGLCGAQGSGKSTMAAALQTALERSGFRTVTLSLDDLYLTAAERASLARRVHPLLRVRGVPGTHDVALGLELLDSLGRAGTTMMPRFDKASDDRGDPVAIEGPFEVILFEGWCVGARPQSDEALAEPINPLEAREDRDRTWRRYVNETLAGPYQRLFGEIDLLVLLAAPGFEVVHSWRSQQEAELRVRRPHAAGVMDSAAVARFIQHYERLTRHILSEMPHRASLTIELTSDRRLASWQTDISVDRIDLSR